MPRTISSESSLDQFKKEAKGWLKAVRAGDPQARRRLEQATPGVGRNPVLRDVQHALAREHGLDGWLALSRAVEAARASRAGVDHAPLAADFVLAFNARDEEALARLNAHYRRAYTFDDLGAEIWRRVYAFRQRSSKEDPPYLRPEEAETLVAQDAGFPGWDALMSPPATRPHPVPAFAIDEAGRSLAPARQLTDREWDRLLIEMSERRLTSLEANGIMSDAVLARVAELPHVTRLDLSGSRQLTDGGVAHLARMPQLRRLTLTGTKVSDRGLRVLRVLPELRAFETTWHPGISDDGVAHLSACDAIEQVNLMGTPTGDGAVAALAGKPELRQFSSGRLLTDVGLRALRRIPRLASWDSSTPFRLLIDGPVTDEGLEAATAFEGLSDLDVFWQATRVTAAGFARLVRLPHLVALGADGALSGDAAMRQFAAMPQLRRLRVQGTIATDEGFEALSASTSLQELWGRDAVHFSSRGFVALSRMPTLYALGVPCGRVEDAALARLPRFPALRILTAIGFDDGAFRHIGRCERLERLSCMYCRDTTDAATAHVAGLQLTSYYAGLTQITDRTLEILGRMTSLEEVELYECRQITDAGLRHLAALSRLRDLQITGMPHVTFAGTQVFPARVRVRYST